MSAWLRKTKNVPGGAPGGLVWNTPEDVVEVNDDALAAELIEIRDAGFVTVPAPQEPQQPAREPVQEAEDGAQPPQEHPADDGAQPEAKPARKSAASKAAAPKTTPQA